MSLYGGTGQLSDIITGFNVVRFRSRDLPARKSQIVMKCLHLASVTAK